MKNLALGCIVLAPILAQTRVQPKPAYEFDVVAIKPNKSGSGSSSINHDNGLWRATNVSVKSLLLNAFDILPEQITGAPGWVDSDRFDIEARYDHTPGEKPPNESRATQQRLEATLDQRFGWEAHWETKQMQTYVLLAGKKGPKLTPASNPKGSSTHTSNGHLEAKGTNLDHLARSLAGWLGGPTVNETGLEGRFDLTLDFEPEHAARLNSSNSPFAGVDSGKPTLITAVQDQLGLKLESRRPAVEILVIDRVNRPSEN